jgi:hypothetical protein
LFVELPGFLDDDEKDETEEEIPDETEEEIPDEAEEEMTRNDVCKLLIYENTFWFTCNGPLIK